MIDPSDWDLAAAGMLLLLLLYTAAAYTVESMQLAYQ